ncbi:MAG: hypothetical protein EPN91_02250 [Salinibacterium sp.]|nr:MAG: hypothetical protein EPN91_02250 [Salinibacterium sp.]
MSDSEWLARERDRQDERRVERLRLARERLRATTARVVVVEVTERDRAIVREYVRRTIGA